jgi:uncharacterized lipoprotein YmbA
MRSRRPILVFAAALLLASCAGTPETHFYVLSSVPAAPAASAAGGTAARRVIAIGPVTLPDYLDQPGIVTRGGPNRIYVASFHQWAGSLPAMTTQALIQDVAARLPGDQVVAFDSGSSRRPDLRVAVAIGQFDVDEAGHAVVAAHFEIDAAAASSAGRSAHDTLTRAQAAGTSYEDRAAALSQALAQLSDQIAQAIGRLGPPAHPAVSLP